MIQIYSPENSIYTSNGDMTLFPSTCILKAELNGAWEMELSHAIDQEGRWRFIVEEAVISAPTFMGEKQLFRIDSVEKSDAGVTAVAYPIFYDAADEVVLLDKKLENQNGQQALNSLTAGTSYSGSSDILTTGTVDFENVNLMEAIQGEIEHNFLQIWGGEILYDNFEVVVNQTAGGDYGVQIQYGKNLAGLNCKVDMSQVVTRIIPVAYNGYMLEGPSPWVDSPHLNQYAKIYKRVVHFDDVKLAEDTEEDGYSTLEELREELVLRCERMYQEGADAPAVTLDINMTDLSTVRGYQDYQILETVRLGDTVHCRHNRLGIISDARVTAMEWDCIRNLPGTLTLGTLEYDYFSSVTSSVEKVEKVVDSGGKLMAEALRGVINANLTQLRAMKDIAQKTGQRAILFEDLDESSPTYGAMAIGTAGFLISSKRTEDGRDWEWSTFGNAQGFYATYLVAGILSSRNYQAGDSGFQLNLDAGTISSKYFTLNENGLVKIKDAMLDGGQLTITDAYGDVIFGASPEGFGFGADTILYYTEEGIVRLNNDVRLCGTLSHYSDDGQRSLQLGDNKIQFYSWRKEGQYLGSIGSVASENRSGLHVWCSPEDQLALSYQDENGNIVAMIMIDGQDRDNPPFVRNTKSGTIQVANVHSITVKNGFITDWS